MEDSYSDFVSCWSSEAGSPRSVASLRRLDEAALRKLVLKEQARLYVYMKESQVHLKYGLVIFYGPKKYSPGRIRQWLRRVNSRYH